MTRPALRYFGAKWRLAPWIIGHMPPHTCYVEPFAGSLAVLLQKPPSFLEYANDADGDIVAFFRVLRDRHDELVAELRLTPYAREELQLAQESCPDDLERARRVYVRCWQSRSGGLDRALQWRYQRTDGRPKAVHRDVLDLPGLEALSRRLRRVGLEQGSYAGVLKRYDAPTTLHYVDPPYLKTVRGFDRYPHDMASEEEHRALADALAGLEGMVLLSGYASPLYAELYEARGWVRVDREAQTQGSNRVESLWINPAAWAVQRQRSLFEVTA